MFKCTIDEPPIPKKQLRCRCIRNRPRLYQPSADDQARYARIFKEAAGDIPPYACPVKWEVYFYRPIPKGTPLKIRKLMMDGTIRPDKRPDDDNYAYMISNACSGAFYDDDARRCESHVYKYYEDENGPRTEIMVDKI